MRKLACISLCLCLSCMLFAQKTTDENASSEILQKAETLLTQGLYDEAFAHFDKAASSFKQLKDWPRYFYCLNQKAASAFKKRDLDLSGSIAAEVIESSGRHLGNNNPAKATACKHLGNVALISGKYPEARKQYERALDILNETEGDQREEIANLHSNLGIVNRNEGGYEKALLAYQRSLEMREELYQEPHHQVAISHHNLGNLYTSMGRYRTALEHYQTSVEIKTYLLGDQHPSLATTYNNMGELYWRLGSFDLAINYVEKAKTVITDFIGEQNEFVPQSYVILGNIYSARQDYDKAIECNKKALDILTAIHEKPYPYFVAVPLTNLSTNKNQRGAYAEALDYIQQALEILKDNFGEKHPKVAECYFTFGNIYYLNGKIEMALDSYRKSLEIAQATLQAPHPQIAAICNQIARVYLDEQNYDAALEFTGHALQANHLDQIDVPNQGHAFFDILDLNEQLRSLYYQAMILEKTGLTRQTPEEIQNAYELYQQADRLVEAIRQNHFEAEDKISFNQTALNVYEAAIMNCLNLFRQTGREDYLDQAFRYSEKSKANTLLQSMVAVDALKIANLPDSLITAERSLKSDISFLQKQMLEARQAGVVDKAANYQSRLLEVKRTYQKHIAELENNYPTYYQLKYENRVASAAEVQKQLPGHTVFLEYFEGQDNIVVFWITRNRFDAIAFEKPKAFDNIVEQLRRATSDLSYIMNQDSTRQVYDNFVNHAHRLYNWLLAPVIARADWKKIRHLLIVPDGQLAYLPFDILLTRKPDNQEEIDYASLDYLLKDYATSYAFSATLLLKDRNISFSNTGSHFVGFAPEYSSGEAYATGTMVSKASLRDLPYARNSVREIAELFPGEAISFLGAAATEEQFKEVAGRYKILHLAMHGVLEDEHPLLSHLVFSNADSSNGDNLLHALELYNMELNAHLAVLSACQTGSGKIRRGEGIMSLSRAFTFAGCPSLVVSLWSIPEYETGNLMIEFYKSLKKGIDKGQSLRQVKLQYLKDPDLLPDRSHPLFWGGLIAIGDTRPVVFSSAHSFWWLLIGIPVLLFGLAWYFRRSLFN